MAPFDEIRNRPWFMGQAPNLEKPSGPRLVDKKRSVMFIVKRIGLTGAIATIAGVLALALASVWQPTAQADSDGEPSPISHINVLVSQDTSSPDDVIKTSFTVTWSDAEDCSDDYFAYLDIRERWLLFPDNYFQGERIYLGSAASGITQITKEFSGLQAGSYSGFDVELYCGNGPYPRFVSKRKVPYASPVRTSPVSSFNFYRKPGTYSSGPGLRTLNVDHGTFAPAFDSNTFDYAVSDVDSAITRTTINATPKTHYAVRFLQGTASSRLGYSTSSTSVGTDSPCHDLTIYDSLGTLNYLTDADTSTPGFQLDLYDGKNSLVVRVYATTNCDVGRFYNLTVTRAEGSNPLPQPNNPATGVPLIRGISTQLGETLTADVSEGYDRGIKDRDGRTNATFSFQWLADDDDITGATSSSYTLTDADLGKYIKVRVSFTDDRGHEETLASDAVGPVHSGNSEATGTLVIVGTPEVGQTLRADVSNIVDGNGLTNATFTVKWENGYFPQNNGDEVHLIARDEGQSIRFRVDFTDDAGYRETLYSEYILVVAGPPNSPATGKPAITGTAQMGVAQVGETLTADTSGIADEDGLDDVSYSYLWISWDLVWALAHPLSWSDTYTVVEADRDRAIVLRVIFSDDAGLWEYLFSDKIVRVALLPNSPATGGPAITGTPRVGETLTADTSSIADADGLDNAVFGYQWIVNDGTTDMNISDATGASYTLLSGDSGRTIKVRITFTDDAGNEEALTSAPTAAVAATVPGAPQDLILYMPDAYAWDISDNKGAARVFWTIPASDGGADITGYKLQWKEAADSWDAPGDVSETTTTIGQDGLRPYAYTARLSGEVVYSVRVIATNSVGDGPPSAEVTRYFHPGFFAGSVISPIPVRYTANFSWYLSGLIPDDDESTLDYIIRIEWVSDSPGADPELCRDPQIQDEYKLYTVPKGIWRSEVVSTGEVHEFEGVGSFTASGSTQSTCPEGVYSVRTSVIRHPDHWVKGTSWDFEKVDVEGGTANTSNSPATGTPTITGTTRVGETLFASTSDITDADGLDEVAFHYRWVANDGTTQTYIPNARESSYTLEPGDEGKIVNVVVQFFDDEGHWETLLGTPTAAVAAPNSPATGTPTVSGTARVGETLTASTSDIADADGLDNASFGYLWISNDGTDDTEIVGATSAVYTLTTDDEGKTIKVVVSFTDDGGNDETLTSTATEAVAPAGPGALWTATLTVGEADGSGQLGYTVFGGIPGGTISSRSFELDGAANWVSLVIYGSDGLYLGVFDEIEGGFELQAGDLKVKSWDASGRDGDNAYIYHWGEPSLNWTEGDGVTLSLFRAEEPEALTDPVNPPATGAPSIIGTARVGDTLTVSTATIEDPDGLDNVSFSYQWISNDGTDDADIDGATDSSYTLRVAEAGKTVKVQLSFTDDAGNDETLTSDATGTVAAKPNTPATGLPTISGTAQMGETLTVDTSGISDEDGLTDVTFSYQWLADDADINGATDSRLYPRQCRRGQGHQGEGVLCR